MVPLEQRVFWTNPSEAQTRTYVNLFESVLISEILLLKNLSANLTVYITTVDEMRKFLGYISSFTGKS
jgi:hypothetical protein